MYKVCPEEYEFVCIHVFVDVLTKYNEIVLSIKSVLKSMSLVAYVFYHCFDKIWKK
jgi:hypothetical protein